MTRDGYISLRLDLDAFRRDQMARRPLWPAEQDASIRQRKCRIAQLQRRAAKMQTRFDDRLEADLAAAERGLLDRAERTRLLEQRTAELLARTDPAVLLAGGIVPGPIGTPLLATVHGGEYVIPADVVKAMQQGPPVFGGKPDLKPDPWPRPKKRKYDA